MYYRVRSSKIDVWNESSSGGAVRTIIKGLLRKSIVGQAVMTCSRGFGAETIVIDKPTDPIPATCYAYNSSLIQIFLSLPKDVRKVVVALPCQAKAIRNINSSILIISPVCFQTVKEEAIVEALHKCGFPIHNSKVQSVYRIHDKLLVNTFNESTELSFNRFWNQLKFYHFSNPQCRECGDHLGMSADIVVFDDKHRSNIVLVRTIRGVEALANAIDDLEIRSDKFQKLRLAVKYKVFRHHVATLLGKILHQ